ncbi:MFS transporter [Haloferax sp. YSMS24]|uniref:MFS transporter n=1 Tax=Haloferax sp. YSMS24 TaxID=3388425 RepID=UPI00398CF139
MSEPEPNGQQGTVTSTGWRTWGTLGSLFLVSAGFIAYAIAPASVLPLFMDTFAVEKPAASASISAVFLTWALLQIPGGYLLDRFDNRYPVFLGTGVFVLASVTGLLTDSYTVFLLTRLLSGASAVFIVVGSVNILGRILPENRKPIGLGIFIASPPFGVAIAQFSGPLIAERYGWQAAILVYTLVAVFGLVVSVALLRQPVRADGRVTLSQFVAALQNRSILFVSTASFCTYAIWTFLNTWMPTYGTEVLGIELVAAGAATALVPLAGIVSRPGGGWLSEKLGGRLQPVILTSFLASILFLYLLSSAPSPTTFAILLGLTGGAVNLAVGLYLVYVNTLADSSTQGTSLSVLLTFSQIGNLVAPLVGGWLIANVSWTAGFGFAAGLAVLGVILIVLAPATN